MSLPILMTDKLIEPIVDFDTDSFTIKEVASGERSISFSIFKTYRNGRAFDALTPKASFEVLENVYVIDTVEQSGGAVVEKSITAHHEIVDRMRSQFCKEEHTATLKFDFCLARCFANTGMTYEIRGKFDSREFENFGKSNQWDLFKQVLSRFNAEYDVKGKHVIIAPHNTLGVVTDAQFRHNHNTQTISESFDTNELATYGEAYADWDDEKKKYNLHVTYTSPSADNYRDAEGNIKYYHKVVYDDKIKHKNVLLNKLKNEMQDVPDYSISITLAELYKNGLRMHPYELFDYVWVIYEPLNMELQARITSRTRYPYAPGKSEEVEIGNYRKDITKQMARFVKAERKIEAVESKVVRTEETVHRAERASQEARELVSGADGAIRTHTTNNQVHLRAGERERWDGKIDVRKAEEVVENKTTPIVDQLKEVKEVADNLAMRVLELEKKLETE
ncbi:phage tail protein [Bacillus sp. FSL W7-1360]